MAENNAIFDAIGSIANIFGAAQQRKLTKEQQVMYAEQQKALAEQQKALELQRQIESERASAGIAESEGLTARFMAKMKANKSYLIPIGIAGAVAILAVTYVYIKKNVKK